jgi:hypothetical protein
MYFRRSRVVGPSEQVIDIDEEFRSFVFVVSRNRPFRPDP